MAGSPAASDASSTSQREPGQNLGSFDGDHRKLVEPRRKSTTRAPDTRNPGVEANLQTSSIIMSQEGGAALDAEFAAGQDPELWDLEEDEAEESVKVTQSNGEYTDNTATEEDAHRSANGCGARWSPVLVSPKNVSTSCVESQRHGTFGVVATCMRDLPSIGKFEVFASRFFGIVAWVFSSTHPGKHWPTCFDQTCGYPGEGPLAYPGFTGGTRNEVA